MASLRSGSGRGKRKNIGRRRSFSGKIGDKSSDSVEVPDVGWYVQDTLREELNRAPGPIISEKEIPERVKGYERLVTVGDHCTLTFIGKGIIPDISIVDFKTRRSEAMLEGKIYAHEIKKIGAKVFKVKNMPGWLSRTLWFAVAKGYREKGKVRIEVDGEEDLASLACVFQAPKNKKTLVVFGIPDRGMVLVDVCRRTRDEVRDFLSRMERR